MDPQDSAKLFVLVNAIAGTSVFVTADGGATWNLIPFFFSSFRLGSFAIDPRAGSNVYAGGIRIWKSMDGGANWMASDAGLAINQPPVSGTAQQVSSIVIDPTDPSILYAGTNGAGVFRSGDAGARWGAFNRDLENLDLTSLALDSRHPAVLYAGSDGNGVFASMIDLSLRSPREVRRLDFRQ